MTETEKQCRVCKIVQPIEQFYKDKNNKSGRRNICASCSKISNKKWRDANPQKVLDNSINYKAAMKIEDPERWRERNRASASQYQNKFRDNYRKYQAEYQRNFLKDPINRLTHNHHIRFVNKMKSCINNSPFNKRYNYNLFWAQPIDDDFWPNITQFCLDQGYSKKTHHVHHIVPIHIFYRFNNLMRDDIISSPLNLEILEATEHKSKWKCVDDKAVAVAGILEKEFNLHGFKHFVATFTETAL